MKNNTSTSFKLLSKDIEFIKQSIEDIKATLKIMDANYVRHEEYHKHVTDDQIIHNDIEARMRNAEKELTTFRSQVATWGTAALIAMSIIQFFLNRFL